MELTDNDFVDKSRRVQIKYYELLDKIDSLSADSLIRKIEKLIDEDPDFFDTYLMIYEIYQDNGELKKANRILNDAYDRAINLITNKKGNWPDSLMWGFLENRHIIRTIFNKAVHLWDEGQNDEALEIFRKLLKTNPNDNVGTRNYILAIRMGMSFEEYEEQFNKGGYYDSESVTWFDKNAPKFPDEFGWWFKSQEEL